MLTTTQNPFHRENINHTLNQCSIKYYNDESNSESTNNSYILTTTIFIKNDKQMLEIDDVKKILFADTQCKYRQVQYDHPCKLFICFKTLDQLKISETFKQNALVELEGIGIDIRNVYFVDDRNSLFLQSLADYTFKRMLKQRVIQNIPTFDIKVGQLNIKKELMIKLYLKKPYIEKLKQFEKKSIYILAGIKDSHKENIFSCKYVNIPFRYSATYGVYETNEDDELVICQSKTINNLSHQNRTKQRGEIISVQELEESDLRGLEVSCSIIPHPLKISTGERFSNIPFCSKDAVDFYYNGDYTKPPLNSYYSYINSELINSEFDEINQTSNDETSVVILLDEDLNSNLLKNKFSERMIEYYNISEKVDSLFIKRGLGFHYAHDYYTTSNVISLDNKWCIVTNKKWLNQITERIKNETIANLINSDLRDIILSSEQEFQPNEFAYNYIISSTFLICLEYFNENNITIEELNEHVWDYILSNATSCIEFPITQRFEPLKITIQNQHNVISVVNPAVFGARSVFCTSFLKKVPEMVIYERNYIYMTSLMSKSPRSRFLSHHFQLSDEISSDNLSLAIHSSSLQTLGERYQILDGSVLKSLFKQAHFLTSELSQSNLPIRECILDDYLIAQAITILTTSKEHISSDYGEYISKMIPTLQDIAIQMQKMKKTLQHDFINTWKKYIEIVTIFLFPIAPKISIYLWTEALQKNGPIRINPDIICYDTQTCESIAAKYTFLKKVFRDIDAYLKIYLQGSKEKKPLKITISNKSTDLDEETLLKEHEEIILQMYRQAISSVCVEISDKSFAKAVSISFQ